MKKYTLFLPLIIFPFIWIYPQVDKDDVILRDHYHFFIKDVDQVKAKFDFGMGKLSLKPNEIRPNEFEGFIEYNPYYMKTPLVTYNTIGKSGKLRIKTKSAIRDIEDNFEFNWNKDRFINNADFKLPVSVAIELDLDFGMGETELDLTGMLIRNLVLECGMVEVDLIVNSPNQIECKTMEIKTGLSDFEGRGLGNIRAETIKIEVGLGSASVDLNGLIIEDMDIEVDVGLGSLKLYLPRNANISAQVNDHFLSSVDVDELVKDGHNWISREWLSGRPTITLDLSVGLGSIDLELVD